MIGLGDAVGQHGLRPDLGERLGSSGNEAVGVSAVDHHGDTGIGTELASAHGQRPGPALTQGLATRLHRFRQHHHRVDRTELAEERDRLRTLGAQIKQRAATGQRAGEAHGLDQRVLDQRMADLATAALDQRKHARMHARAGNRRRNRLRNDLAGAGMGRMPLHHDRAAGCKCCRRVTAGSRKGEREVRGAEHCHRTHRPLDQPDLWARQRLAVGQCGIQATVEIVALLDVVGKQAKLAGRAAALALQAGFGQAGFLAADLGDLGGACLNLVGNGAQEGSALLARGVGVAPEGVLCGFAGAVDQIDGAGGKLMRGAMRRRACEGAGSVEPFARDEVFSLRSESHATFLSG